MSIFLHSSGRYYYRQHIPIDLRPQFNNREDIAQSLKTRHKDEAVILATMLQKRFEVAFTLIRTGFVEDDVLPSIFAATRLRHKKTLPSASCTKVELEVSPSPEPPTPPPERLLSSLFSMYVDEHKVGWKPKTLLEFEGWLRLLLLVIGDIPVSVIDRSVCVACRDTLRKIPPGYTKKKSLRDLPVSELVKVDGPGLHPKTVNKHVQMLSSIFRWAKKYGYMAANPAEDLSLSVATNPDEERRPYDADDLQRVIDNLPITEGVSSKVSGTSWIPLIAMYSGLRLEEICQLTPSDIIMLDDVLCFDLTRGKNLKTFSAARIVPVHTSLLSMGLHEYVKSIPAGSNPWGVIKAKRNGWSKLYSQQWGRWARKNITTDPLKVFHSFRHNVADALKLANVQEPLIKQILGHSNTDITTGRYGSKFPPSVVFDAIKQITYTVDLRRLMLEGCPESESWSSQ